jgi:predicted deacylase
LNVMAAIGMLDPLPHASRVEIAVEDPRPSSGHMQRCYPAPAAGCFECAVALGQAIRIGELLGCIIDPLGQARHEVRSTQTGRIIVLRTLAAVHQGDSLAVVLETPNG